MDGATKVFLKSVAITTGLMICLTPTLILENKLENERLAKVDKLTDQILNECMQRGGETDDIALCLSVASWMGLSNRGQELEKFLQEKVNGQRKAATDPATQKMWEDILAKQEFYSKRLQGAVSEGKIILPMPDEQTLDAILDQGIPAAEQWLNEHGQTEMQKLAKEVEDRFNGLNSQTAIRSASKVGFVAPIGKGNAGHQSGKPIAVKPKTQRNC